MTLQERVMSEIATLEDFPSRKDRQAKIAEAEREVIAAAFKWWRAEHLSEAQEHAIVDLCLTCANLAVLKGEVE